MIREAEMLESLIDGGPRMNTAEFFEALLPSWRDTLPPSIDRAYFDAFVARHRAQLEATLALLAEPASSTSDRLAREPAADLDAPRDGRTGGERTAANLAARQLVVRKTPGNFTAAELGTLVRGKFPPGLIPETFGLIHEYYTPTILADAVCPLLPARRCAALQGATRGTFNLVVSNPPYGERGVAALEDTDTFYKENRAQAAARGTADGQLRAPRSNLGAEAAKLACATGQTAAANEDGPATPPVPAKPPTPATSPAASTPSAPSTPSVDPEKDRVLMDGFESTVQKLIAARKGAT